MGRVVCRFIPDRTKPRPFTCKDAKRISRYAAETTSPECVAREVLWELGFGEELCSLLKAAIAIARIEDAAGLVRILIAISTLISAIMFALRPFEGVSRRIKALLVLMGAAQVALSTIIELLGDFDLMLIQALHDSFCEDQLEE